MRVQQSQIQILQTVENKPLIPRVLEMKLAQAMSLMTLRERTLSKIMQTMWNLTLTPVIAVWKRYNPRLMMRL